MSGAMATIVMYDFQFHLRRVLF